jgi:UDP-glucose 4-epimerase
VSRTILVTGGAGFIGSHVAAAFVAKGWQVAVVDDLSTGKEENIPEGVEFHKADITDEAALKPLFSKLKPRIINHHAAQTSVRISCDDPARDLQVNVLGTLNLITLAAASGAELFVFASTGGAIYGDGVRIPTPEDALCRPTSPYGVGKLGAEHYLEWAGLSLGLPSLRLRYANVYGPRQDPHGEAGVVAIFSRSMLAGGQPMVNGDGKQTRDYVYVGDVVEANTLGSEMGVTGAYNVGTGVETDVNTLFEKLADLTGFAGEKRHGPAKPGEQARSCLDASRLGGECGWEASTSLEEGLKATVDWFRGRGRDD